MEGLFGEGRRESQVPCLEQVGGSDQGPRPRPCWSSSRSGHELDGAVDPFPAPVVVLPERAQGGDDPEPRIQLTRPVRPGQGGADVVDVAAQSRDPVERVGSEQVRLRLFRPFGKELGVAALEPFQLARCGGLLACKGPDGEQEPESTARARSRVGFDEGAIDEGCEEAENVATGQRGIAADRLDGSQPDGPREDGKAREEDSFVGHEQAMTPLKRGSKGVVVRPDRPTDRREQGHLLQCALELRRRIGPQQRRGQLDGKWQAIEAPADLRDRREIRGLGPEIRPGRTRAVGEQPHGVVLGTRRSIGRRRGRAGRSKRMDEIRQLAVDSERLAARRKHPKIGRRAHGGTDGVGGSRGHVLAVVEDEQHPTTGDDLRQCVGRRAVLWRRTTQGGQHDLGDERVFGDRRQVAESDLQAGRCA